MDFSAISADLLIQLLIGVFIVGQLQRLIVRVGGFGDRLAKIEAEHNWITGECRRNIEELDRRKTSDDTRRQQLRTVKNHQRGEL